MPVAHAREQRLMRIALAQKEQAVGPDPAQDALWAQSLWTWVCDQVQTVDEASKEMRPWPAAEKPYTEEVFALLQSEQMLAFPKSRRMMISWCVAAFLTWVARYHPFRLLLVQSATEAKAAYLVGERCRFIEEHLRDQRYKRSYTAWRTKGGLVGKLQYRGTGSQIIGVAQGADIVRSYTFSFLAMDECEFQPEGPQALVAAIPAVEKGAQIVLISTSNGPQGPLAKLCKEVGFLRWTG